MILNSVSAGMAWFAYWRAGHFSAKLTLPIVGVSVPAAYLGASLKISEVHYQVVLGIVLLAVALRLLLFSNKANVEKFETPPKLPVLILTSIILGLISGAIGIGGGVFLSPLLILASWADSKTTSATAAAFTTLNSISGVISKAVSHRLMFDLFSLQGSGLIVCALIGSFIGSRYGSKIAPPQVLMRLIAAVLLVAVLKLLFTKGH